jgi:hypothetical protein
MIKITGKWLKITDKGKNRVFYYFSISVLKILGRQARTASVW